MTTREAREPRLFDLLTPAASLPEGMLYRADFLSREEEDQLLDRIAGLDFGEVRMHGVVARRRVVQYGWHYGFDSRALQEGRPVPAFLVPFRERVASLMQEEPERLSEVLVTEYRPGATIGWHRDAPPSPASPGSRSAPRAASACAGRRVTGGSGPRCGWNRGRPTC